MDNIYKITKAVNNCLKCGSSIKETDRHPSMLVESEDEILRKDYCANCWSEVIKDKMFSFWISKRYKPPEDKRLIKKTRNENLINLFYTFADKDKDYFKFHLYVLAHLLMKYKVFLWDKETIDNEGKGFLNFKDTLNATDISISDIDEESEDLVKANKEVEDLLSGKIPEILVIQEEEIKTETAEENQDDS